MQSIVLSSVAWLTMIAWCVGVLAAPSVALAQQEQVMVIFDGSGSMRGRVDGKRKITIAKEVLKSASETWAEQGQEVGIVAYGHRRRKDCADIETLREPAFLTDDLLTAEIKKLRARGNTPLTAAVRHAAEVLQIEAQPGTVVLLSDGKENCDADPCDMARELEAAGNAFTALVIGFDVPDEAEEGLRCLAEETGGVYVAARDASSLLAAFGRVLSRPQVQVVALDDAGDPLIGPVRWRWTSGDTRGARTTPDGHIRLTGLPRDALEISATTDDHTGRLRLESDETGREISLRTQEIAIRLLSPLAVRPSTVFDVFWVGDNRPSDAVILIREGASERAPFQSYGTHAYEKDGEGQLKFLAPLEPGRYEIVYRDRDAGETRARRLLVVTPNDRVGQIVAPKRVQAGEVVRVEWTGVAQAADWLSIAELGAPLDDERERSYVRFGLPAEFVVSEEPGRFEVRFVDAANQTVLARQAIEVVGAMLDAHLPDTVAPRTVVTAQVNNDFTLADYVSIAKPWMPGYRSLAATRIADDGTVTLTAPIEAGAYELRFIRGRDRKIMARNPFSVE